MARARVGRAYDAVELALDGRKGRALARAGLDAFRFHDLRHFAVSALIAAGADIKLLQANAGHASATMTLDTYGHLMTARVQEAATRYDPLAVSFAEVAR